MSSLDKLPDHEKYILDILLYCAVGSVLPKDRNNASATVGGIVPCAPGQKGVPLVVPVLLSTLEGISHIRIFMPKDIRSESARETLWKSVQEVHRRFPDGIALLDPIENMDIKDEKFKTLVNVSLDVYTSCSLLTNCSEDRCHGEEDVLEFTAQRSSTARVVFNVPAQTRKPTENPVPEEADTGHP